MKVGARFSNTHNKIQNKKDFYGKIKPGQETVSMLYNKSVCNFQSVKSPVEMI